MFRKKFILVFKKINFIVPLNKKINTSNTDKVEQKMNVFQDNYPTTMLGDMRHKNDDNEIYYIVNL